MGADVLREAARLMREQATAARPLIEPAWPRRSIDCDGSCDCCAEHKHLVAAYDGPDSEPWMCAECAIETDYVDSWHPAVALAVADWLEATADEGFSDEDYVPGDFLGAAVALARAYLAPPVAGSEEET